MDKRCLFEPNSAKPRVRLDTNSRQSGCAPSRPCPFKVMAGNVGEQATFGDRLNVELSARQAGRSQSELEAALD